MIFLNYLIISLFYINTGSYSSKTRIKTIIKNNELLNFDIYNNSLIINKNYLTFEHIWPRSLLGPNAKHAKNDFHNIYVTERFFNEQRSNYKFVDQIIDYPKIVSLDNIYNDSIINLTKYNYKNSKDKIFMPIYSSRGKISRSILYMQDKYNLKNIKKIINEDVMHLWNRLYPPDIHELYKHEFIFERQKKINKYIDDYYKYI